MPPRRALVGLAVLLAALTAGLLVSPARVVSHVDAAAADPLVFGLLVAGCYLIRPLFAWPTTPLAALVGYGLGITAGVPIALAGVLVTVTPPFVAVRWASGDRPGDAPAGWWASSLDRAREYVDRYYETTGPIRGVVASRLAPIPSDIATGAAAIHGVSLPHFLLGTALGELPWTTAAVVVGASAATLSAEGLGSLDPAVLAVCLLAAVLVLAGPLYRTLTDRHRAVKRT